MASLSPLRELAYTFLNLTNGKQKEIVNQLGNWSKNSYHQDSKDCFFSLYDAAEKEKKLGDLWDITMKKANSEKINQNPF